MLGLGLGLHKQIGLRKVGAPVVDDFIITINTTLGDGLNQIRLPIQGTDPMDIDWGDGTIETVVQTATPSSTNWVTHSYASAYVGDIKISNNIKYIRFNNEGDSKKLTDVKQWGTALWNAMFRSFTGCENISIFSAIDAPNLTALSDLRLDKLFESCSNFNSNINNWRIPNVISIRDMFQGASSFNQPFEDMFNSGNVSDITSALRIANSYDQSLANFNVVNISEALNFMQFSLGLSTPNYDATLIGWEQTLQNAYPNGVGYPNTGLNIHFGSSQYTLGSAADTARASLTNPSTFGWVIADGGGGI